MYKVKDKLVSIKQTDKSVYTIWGKYPGHNLDQETLYHWIEITKENGQKSAEMVILDNKLYCIKGYETYCTYIDKIGYEGEAYKKQLQSNTSYSIVRYDQLD